MKPIPKGHDHLEEIDWKAEARKWESRAKSSHAEIRRLTSRVNRLTNRLLNQEELLDVIADTIREEIRKGQTK